MEKETPKNRINKKKLPIESEGAFFIPEENPNKGRSTMEQIIKKYLEELAEKDQFFKEKYNPEHLEWCIKYIYRQAKFIAEQTKQKSMIAIKEDTVFHWAREYFDEGTNLKEEEERSAQKAREEVSNKIVPEHDEDEDTSELEADINARIEESRKKAEEYDKKKKEEERYKREHANGQITIFDILGGQQ